MTETALDRAWAAAEAGEGAMARYYDVFAATEFFLMVEPETLEGDGPPRPVLFEVEGVATALIFDTEARLADFAEGAAAHLTLSGRAVAEMFAGKGAQLGVNLGDAPSATILPAEAVDWAAAAFRQPIEQDAEAGLALTVPRGASPHVFAALDAKLAGLGAEVAEAWLCGLGGAGATAKRGEEPLILCLRLRAAFAESGVVAALAETARFAGGDRPAFDIAVLAEGDPRLAQARRVGLGFEPAAPSEPKAPKIPGGDPEEPPILR